MHCVGLLFEEIRKNLHMSILVLVEAPLRSPLRGLASDPTVEYID